MPWSLTEAIGMAHVAEQSAQGMSKGWEASEAISAPASLSLGCLAKSGDLLDPGEDSCLAGCFTPDLD